MKRYHCILWDLDGTVIDTYEGVSKSLQQAFEYYGVHMDGPDYYPFVGPPLRKSLPQHTDVPADLLEDVIARFRKRYNTLGVLECAPFPGAKEAMASLFSAGYVQIIASSKPEERCREIMHRFEMDGYLAEIVGASADGRIDTKTEVLCEVFRRLGHRNPGFSRDEMVLIGDTRYDADGAREAGIDCIGVSYGYDSPKALRERGVETIYDSLTALAEDLLQCV